jgi:hypothetical protein
MSRHEITTRRVLYEIPGMQSVPVREDSFRGADGQPLPMKIYGDQGPSVVILEGYPDAGFQKHVGCTFMEMEWTISMAQLIAASGMTAVTHANRDPLPDAQALLNHLASRGDKIGIWSTSGHAPIAVQVLSQVQCAVLSNPLLAQDAKTARFQGPQTPLFVIRSGQDQTPGLNAALDPFIQAAIAANDPVTVVNLPSAPHSFDLFFDSEQTRHTLREALAFLRVYLAS